MDVLARSIYRKECADCGSLIGFSHAPGCAGRPGRYRWAVREYVPADLHQGAVSDRGKLVADLRGLADRLASIGADQAAEEVGVLVTAYGGRYGAAATPRKDQD